MRLRPMTISAAMAALALTLPLGFHMAGLGSQFLPMLLPLLINGFLVGPGWAVLTGLSAPLLSGLATGMPPLYPPVVLIVALEGATLGGVAALVRLLSRRRVWPALISAVCCGRLLSFALSWALAGRWGLPPALSAWAALLHGLPGVALQLGVTPLVVGMLERRRSPLFADEP